MYIERRVYLILNVKVDFANNMDKNCRIVNKSVNP